MYSVAAELIATGKNIVNDRRRSFSVILRAGSSAAKETAEREGDARLLRLGSMCVVWEPRRKRPTTEGYNGELDVYMNIKDARFRIATALKYESTIACESNRLADHVACRTPLVSKMQTKMFAHGFCRCKFVDQPSPG